MMDKILDNLEIVIVISEYVLCVLCLYIGMELHDSYYIALAVFDYMVGHNIATKNKLTK
jgi:hypothetical protein